MKSLDAIYTPVELATLMVKIVNKKPNLVADFTCGDGGLLRAAAKRWPSAKFIATDVSCSAVKRVSAIGFVKSTGRCDFLSSRSKARCKALRDIKGKVDVVLLNPPFTCRGGTRLFVGSESLDVWCSTAMAFLLYSLEYLGPSGEIVAILPAGSMRSEKDSNAWSILRNICQIAIVSEHDHRTFGSCAPTTTIVHLKKRKSNPAAKEIANRTQERRRKRKPGIEVTLYRGKVQMHSVVPGRVPLAHSTDLKDYRLVLNGHRTNSCALSLKGPFIALPRVGAPQKEKIALYDANRKVALSDCILALACDEECDTIRLHKELVRNWPILKSLYAGTGAKYLTAANLADALRKLGYSVVPHSGANHQLRRSIGSDENWRRERTSDRRDVRALANSLASNCPRSHKGQQL